MNICYIEDEVDLSNIIRKYLEKEGYHVTNFSSGEDFLKSHNFNFDLYILDIMLQGDLNGYDLIKIIKENLNAKVIFTSARNQDIDKIMGLELGSDDYISKPFSPRELILRVKNILKKVDNSRNNMIYYDNYKIDIEKRLVYNNEEIVELSYKEFECLYFFLKNKGKAYSREDILNHVWEENYFGSDRVVDDLIRRVRSKLTDLRLETIYGYGYRLL